MTEEQEGKSKFSFVQTEAPPNVRLWDSQMAVAYNKPSWKEEGGRRVRGPRPGATGWEVGSRKRGEQCLVNMCLSCLKNHLCQ